MHSLWGQLNQLSDKKGWTHQYMLEEISWANIQMYLADQVQLIKSSEIIINVSKSELKEHKRKLAHGQ